MKQTAVDKAYTWLRERILDGTLSGGTFIDEATVCEAAGVSRTPAREAFNRLEGERFISLVPRRGAQVRELNSSHLYEAFHARFMIEAFAAAEFCAGDRDVPAEMVANLKVMDGITDFTSLERNLEYLNADREFHAALIGTLNNRPIIDFFESLWRTNSWAAINRSKSSMRSESWVAANRTQHHAIADALAAHDAAAAEAALRAHLKITPAEFSSTPS